MRSAASNTVAMKSNNNHQVEYHASLLWWLLCVVVVFSFPLYAYADVSGAQTLLPKFHVLDRISDIFKPLQNTWYTAIKVYAERLFWLLVLVDFGWSSVIYVLEKSDVSEIVTSLAKKFFTIGFFWSLLKFSDTWIPAIIHSFMHIGVEVGKSGSVTPDGIAATGVDLALSAFGLMQKLNLLESLAVILPVAFIAIMIFLSFLFVAMQLLVTLIESYIAIGAGVILLGFGGSRWTTDFATKYLQYAVSTGVKLMLLYLIVGVGQTLFDHVLLDPNELMQSCFIALGSAVVYAYLAIQIPAIATAMISGTPSLTAGGLAASALTVGAAAAGVGAATYAAGKATAGGIGGAVAGASGLSQALSAGMNAGADLGKSGISAFAHGVGEVASHGLGLGASAIGSAVTSAKSGFAESVANTTGGKIASSIESSRGGSMSSPTAPSASPSGDASTAALSSDNGSTNPNKNSAKDPWHERIKRLEGYVPQDASGSASPHIDMHHTRD